jgi:hypothetical protein
MCKKCKSCKKHKKQKCVKKCFPMTTSLDIAGLTSYSSNGGISLQDIIEACAGSNGGAGCSGGTGGAGTTQYSIDYEFW